MEKSKVSKTVMTVFIVAIILLSSGLAYSYSSVISQNSRISALNGELSSKDKTISEQNTTINELKTNETDLNMTLSELESSLISSDGNYSKVSLLLSIAEQKYGISTNMLFYNYTVTVAAKTDMFFVREINPVNNTTLFFVSPVVASPGTIGSVNSTIYNLTLLLNATASSGASFSIPITEPNYALYINNENNYPLTFSFTMFLMWRS
ncbi:MAG: hypothetical protein M1556_07300 [Candidatus Thermoplasmatota archaeon]|jgi:cell division protein FtsB|nr:hypothetical protein [Candidatus Thermoplasmatota archaeon]MCL6003429.1 hypothetical protein [Candidatus Thermoplasmatota archaeon]